MGPRSLGQGILNRLPERETGFHDQRSTGRAARLSTAKTYRYDRLGRLVRAQHESAITKGCVTRTYSYDDRTNRSNSSQSAPGVEGECDESTATGTRSHTFDTADRLTDDGYLYDAFGRTTNLPGGLVNSYFTNDLVQRQQLDDARQTWTLDPAHRFRAFTTETLVDGSWVNATSRLNHYGDDSDEPRWIVEDTTLGSVTRNVSGPDSGREPGRRRADSRPGCSATVISVDHDVIDRAC